MPKINYKQAYLNQKAIYLELLKELADESKERAQAEDRAARIEQSFNELAGVTEKLQDGNQILSTRWTVLKSRVKRMPWWISKFYNLETDKL